MQYSVGAGTKELCSTLADLNLHLHNELPCNAVTLHVGNADGVNKCFRLLGDPGDNFLVEEFSFPGLTHAPLAHGIRWIPVRLDNQGLLPDHMESILKNWDEAKQGRRPHVLYTIPYVTRNRSGSILATDHQLDADRILLVALYHLSVVNAYMHLHNNGTS